LLLPCRYKRDARIVRLQAVESHAVRRHIPDTSRHNGDAFPRLYK
jgi:hypothetical protein